MWLSLLKRYWTYIAVAVISIILTIQFSPKEVEIREKIVTEVQEREVVRTVIKEQPDGTKVTIIDSKRETDTKIDENRVTIPSDKLIVGISMSTPILKSGEPIYGLSLQRRILGDISLGAYARTDKELGVILGYSF